MNELIDPLNHKLNLYCREVDIEELPSPEIQSTLSNMKSITVGERDEAHPDRRSLVGLSAPQMGELIRVIIIDIASDPAVSNFNPDLKFFINPRIIKSSPEENLGREGCFSVGEICGAVFRANEVTVAAIDENGKDFTYQSGNHFQARILQHEIDHLNGIRFPSRVREQKHLHRVGKDEFQDYRENWSTWDKIYPFQDWLKMYRGEK
jgi:peptide deformylase